MDTIGGLVLTYGLQNAMTSSEERTGQKKYEDPRGNTRVGILVCPFVKL